LLRGLAGSGDAQFGAARAELSVLKLCRVVTNWFSGTEYNKFLDYQRNKEYFHKNKFYNLREYILTPFYILRVRKREQPAI
jgi:hypothetical protein